MRDDDVPRWRVTAETWVSPNRVLYLKGATITSSYLPRDGVSLRPVNDLAERIAAYARKVGPHHPRRPVQVVNGFLPAMLRCGPGQWSGPYCAITEHMPHYRIRGAWCGWPNRHDRPSNPAAERVMEYWLENRDHPDFEEHGCWNALTDALHLPWLQPIRDDVRVPLDGTRRVMVDRPGSGYGPLEPPPPTEPAAATTQPPRRRHLERP